MVHPNGERETEFGSNSVFSEELTSTCVIAIQAENNDFQIGIIGSTDDHVVTNATWRCTNDEEADWFTETFDDSHWPSAHAWFENGGGGMGMREDIDSNANWIWTENQNDQTVYCRKQLCSGTLF